MISSRKEFMKLKKAQVPENLQPASVQDLLELKRVSVDGTFQTRNSFYSWNNGAGLSIPLNAA